MVIGVALFAHGGNGTASMSKSGSSVEMILILFLTILWFIFYFRLTIKRAHDMGWAGLPIFLMFWGLMIATGIVRGVGGDGRDSFIATIFFQIVVGLFLLTCMVKPGTSGPNRFGQPPSPTPVPVQIMAWIFLALMAIIFVGRLAGLFLGYFSMHRAM
jgi:uncharacterized membrane protein YhaH (DUF805 family)